MKTIFILLFFTLYTVFAFSQEWTYLGFSDQRINAVAVHPQNPNIIFCSGNSLQKSTDEGVSWNTVSMNFNSITFYPGYPDTMFATLGVGSFSDGVYKSTDGGNTWSVLDWIYKATSVIVPEFPSGYIYVGSREYGVYKSSDYGQNFELLNDSLENLKVLSMIDLYPSCIPEDPINLYIAGTQGGIFFFPEHTWVTSADEYWHNTNTASNASIPALSKSYYGDVLWAVQGGGSNSDGMYYSNDLGSSWILSEYWDFMTDILVNPLNSETVFAADSGEGVKRTINSGLIWEYMNNNLGDLRVHCLGQSSADTMHLYAGTEAGLYVYDYITGINANATDNIVKVFPNPTQDVVNIQANSEINTVKIFDSSGKLLKSLYPQSDNCTIDISAYNRGLYMVRVFTGNTNYSVKINK